AEIAAAILEIAAPVCRNPVPEFCAIRMAFIMFKPVSAGSPLRSFVAVPVVMTGDQHFFKFESATLKSIQSTVQRHEDTARSAEFNFGFCRRRFQPEWLSNEQDAGRLFGMALHQVQRAVQSTANPGRANATDNVENFGGILREA